MEFQFGMEGERGRKPERHIHINEQYLQKLVLPNVEHLGELYNGNYAWKQKAIIYGFPQIPTLCCV